MKLRFWFLSLVILSSASCAYQTGHAAAGIDKKHADNFQLSDQNGRRHELYQYSDKKVVVIVSQGNGCPIIRKSLSYLEELDQEFRSQGVVFFLINANSQDDRQSIMREAADFGITLPILEDRSQAVVSTLGIDRTAEAVVIDPKDWSIVYRGAIHDQLGYESQKSSIQKEYLKDAINAVLQGRPVPVFSTPVKGCLISGKR